MLLLPKGVRTFCGIVRSRKFLVGVDGSEFSTRAVETALSLMNKERDSIYLLTVPTVPFIEPRLSDDIVQSIRDARRTATQEIIDDACKLCSDHGAVNIEAIVTQEHLGPRSELLDATDRLGIDYLVLGSRGMSPIQRLVVGSTVDYLIYHVRCNVVIVR